MHVLGTEPPIYTHRSDEMAEIGRKYHHELQTHGIESSPDEYEETVKDVLGSIKTSLTENDRTEMSQNITQNEIHKAIQDLPEGKAPGLDGIPHELWKKLAQDFKDNKDCSDYHTFDVVKLLWLVYTNIQEQGIAIGTDFAEGWMCPIYKKKR